MQSDIIAPRVEEEAWFAKPALTTRRCAEGGWLVASSRPVPDHPPRLTDQLAHWSRMAPERPFLKERNGAGWRSITYAEANKAARAIAAALLARGLGPDRPVAVLCGPGIDHALLGLGAQLAGVPYAPVSPPYSLASGDLGRLRAVLGVLRPGLIFVDRAAPFARALALPEAEGIEVVASDPMGVDGAGSLADLLAHSVEGSADRVFAGVDPDGTAKILFTSGSTGVPKGVPLTHRMLAANQEQIAAVWPFLRRHPPVLLDWLPWHHVFGGCFNLGLVLRHGGTLWLDEGRPAPGQFETTLRNMRDVSPTVSINVPRGYELLIPALEADEALCRTFFAELRVLFYAAATLAPELWQRLEELARRHAPHPVHMLSSWGMTETSPACLAVHVEDAPLGGVGLPLPGLELKLVPNDDKLEARVRGPNIMPGYWRDQEASSAAFDEEGFFRTGDALRWIDPQDLARGLRFDGRLTEDFKLSSGTRVNAGEIRGRALPALGAVARDVLVVGADRDEVGLLLVPHEERRDEIGSPALAGEAEAALRGMNSNSGGGSARTVTRAMFLIEPLSFQAGEITDKGSVNVRRVLSLRPALLERLYDGATEEVIRP